MKVKSVFEEFLIEILRIFAFKNYSEIVWDQKICCDSDVNYFRASDFYFLNRPESSKNSGQCYVFLVSRKH